MTETKTIKIGNYQVLELIHKSERTLVYHGINMESGQSIIVKLMGHEYPSFNELVQFRNQYAIAKNLDIPGMIKPYSLERYKNGYALIMEDIGAMSLAEYQRQFSVSFEQFWEISLQIVEILHHLHQNYIIHKDIKPANILIHLETKEVKLIDFSISSLLPKERTSLQTPNVLEGTLAYISPEQTGRMNRGIDYRSDFYSLGVTFYELLSGKLPFESEDPLELVHAHIAKNPPRIPETKVPTPLADIVLKLMGKNAEERYQSALGLKYDLEKCRAQFETGKIEAFVLGERDLCDRFLLPEKLYGREIEVQTLLDGFERVAAGQTEMMLVAGYSGIGKTAVVNEVHKPITRQKGYFINGKFDQFNRNIPFSAFVIAFRDLMRQLLGESDAELQKWKGKILAAVGDSGQVLIEVIPELERIIGEQPSAPELSGSAAQNRFNLLFEKFIAVFTTIEHPLTIFIDDLQWADSASLNLLKVLMGDTGTGYLLLLGAYRDNEVFPAHPLMLTLRELEKRCDPATTTGASGQTPRRRQSQGNADQERERAPREQNTTISTITLTPLSVSHINQLVAETLSCTLELATPLTDLVCQKTKGNPFFTTQFLKGLHEDGLIAFNQNLGYWECDLVQVQDAALTDDVVEFMATRLHKLPEETQKVLKLAACIGNQFDLETLAIICKIRSEEVASYLWSALREGLILPQSQAYKFFQGWPQDEEKEDDINVGYRLLHDRVQQAAYNLISEEDKQATHLKIGTLLLENLSETDREERIFEIVNHFNIGKKLIADAAQKRTLIQLNLSAGRKAKASTAYAGALSYIEAGMELLSDRCWKDDYEIAFALHKERAEVEHLNGHFEAAEMWIYRALGNVKTAMEKVEFYNIAIIQNTLQAKYTQAIDAGRQALALMGIELPENDFEAVRDAELEMATKTLQGRSFVTLMELPVMDKPEKQMAIKLLITLGPPTYRSHQRLWSVICAKAVNLCLNYGNTPEVGYIYPAFGGLRGYALNNYQGTDELLNVAIQLTQAFNNKSAESVAYLMIGSSLRHWSHPLKVATEDYLSSYRVGLESSNLQYAAYAFGHNMYCRFYQSVHLEELLEEVGESLAFGRKYKNQWAIDLLIGGQAIFAQLAQTSIDSPQQLASIDESDYLEQCRLHKNWQVICIYNILKTQFLFLLERFDEALESGREATAEIINVAPQGLLPYPRHIFIYSLLLASLYSQASESQKVEYSKKIWAYQKQLDIWAHNCPVNFLHLSCLVKAEIDRISGDVRNAIEMYDRAIAGAKENKYIQEEALANELAAKFYLEWGKEKIAPVYMTEAYYCYAQWGAKAKIEHLEKHYPQLLTPILQRQQLGGTTNSKITTLTKGTVSPTGTSPGELLDLASLIKASRSLSQEIDLKGAIANFMAVIQENAGAETVVLMNFEENTLMLTAHATKEEMSVIRIPVDTSNNVPLTLVNQVKNTCQHLVLDNAKKDNDYGRDDYIQKHQPQSVLCMPLIDRGKVIGILYLENNQTSGAFTSDRIEILNLLCSQAAIALQNAQLYHKEQLARNDLQQALTDLQQAQLQLVQSEKMATLGNLVAGVAHEINNPVGFIGGNVDAAQEHLQDLLSILSLYQENTSPPQEIAEEIEELEPDFIAEDFPKLIASMEEGCNIIRNISKSLRTFSRNDTASKTEFNLHEGIDSTLLILKYRLKANEQRHAIEIIKKYGDIPAVKCYPGQLNQVFMNLLANAIDALDESNEGKVFEEIEKRQNCITISTELSSSDYSVIVRISDNGVGMPEEVKAKIFQQGFTTKGVGKGTGLGMAIAHQIVTEKHGGMISCDSTVGEGTTFTIMIPR